MTDPVAEVVARRARAGASPWISSYVGYRYEGFDPGTHTGMPGPSLTFIISLGDPVDIVGMPGVQPPGRFQAFVGGLHTGPARIAHDGTQYGVAVDLTPLGARALYGMPAGELAAQVVDLDEVLGPGARSLPDRLASLATWGERLAVLDAVLDATARAADGTTAPPPEVGAAFRLLVDSGGRADVGRVADAVGWSRRHLAERFRTEIGLAPKATARVARFDRARRLVARRRHRTLADVAAEAGYADQAHFNREFRELAGRTPREWLAEELPSVQDPEPVDVGG